MKVAANNWAKIMHSEEALSVDFYRYDTQLSVIREHKKIISYDNNTSRACTRHLLSFSVITF